MALQTKDFSLTAKSGHGKITYTYTIRVTENTTDPVKNSSHVTVQAILQQSYSGTAFSGYRTGVSCTVDGETLFSDYCRRTIAGREEHVFYAWEGWLPHEADGTKVIHVSGKLWQPTAADYTPPTMEIPEGTLALTPIPRASRVGATDCAIGSASTLVITPAAEGCSHVLQYAFGEETGYIYADGSAGQEPRCLEGNTFSFLVPESFYDQIPAQSWDDCTLTCHTYLGDTCIGSSQTVFQVTAAESRCAPLATWTLQDVCPETLALTGDAGVLIRYMSCLQVTLESQARCAAWIVRQQLGGKEMEADSAQIPQVESGNIWAVVEDSRGYTCRLEETMPMSPYVKLTNNATVARTSPTDGKALLRFSGNCYCGSFGIRENTLVLSYRLQPEGGAFTPWQELECAIGEDHTYQLTWELEDLDYTKSYVLQVQAKDALEEALCQLSVMPGIPVYHWKKDRFYFHVPVECDSTVSGSYIRSHNLLAAVQLELAIEPGQTVFLFGCGGQLCGAVGGAWWGSPGVTAEATRDGVKLVFQQPISGGILLISDRQFHIE